MLLLKREFIFITMLETSKLENRYFMDFKKLSINN